MGMTYSEISFLLAYLMFLSASFLLMVIGVYFTTALGTASFLSIATFIFFNSYFFEAIKKTEC